MSQEPVYPSWIREARKHLGHAYELYEAGVYREGFDECLAAVENDPACAEAYNLAGVLLEKLDRPREALDAYRKASALDRGLVEAKQNETLLGDECLAEAVRLFESGQESRRALELCNLALEVDRDSAAAHNLRGALLEQLGHSHEAAEAYRRAIRLDPGLQVAAENLAYLEDELARETPEAEEADGAEVDEEADRLADETAETETGEPASVTTSDEAEDGLTEDDAGQAETSGFAASGVSWLKSWLLAFARVVYSPRPATFRELAADADRKFNSAVGWLAGFAVFSTLLYWFVLDRQPFGLAVLVVAGARVIAAVGLVFLFTYVAGFLVRKVILRHRTYVSELSCAFIVIYVAIGTLSKLLALIPLLGANLPPWLGPDPLISYWRLLPVLAYPYMLILSGIAVKSIVRLTGWQAAMVVGVSGFLTNWLARVVILLLSYMIYTPGWGFVRYLLY
jgi:tetratricopeptide (TPR) repeat protein